MASEGRTVQQVLRTQVDVDAAVEAGDEPVEDPLLQTQTCRQGGDTRLQTQPSLSQLTLLPGNQAQRPPLTAADSKF